MAAESVLVTGTSSGIGEALARLFAADGSGRVNRLLAFSTRLAPRWLLRRVIRTLQG